MRIRTSLLGLTIATVLAASLAACGSDASPTPPASTNSTPATSASSNGGGNNSMAKGLEDVTYPPGAKVEDFTASSKQYEVTGMTINEVIAFFDSAMAAKGYTKTKEANASHFYENGGKKIQITWADFDGTIRGVARETAMG